MKRPIRSVASMVGICALSLVNSSALADIELNRKSALEKPNESTKVSEWGALADDTVSESIGFFVRGGRPVTNPKEWESILYPKIVGDVCTAVLVGPEVILTAAHCVNHHQTLSFSLKGKPFTALCEQADGYRTKIDTSSDYALCKVSPVVAGIRFERIITDPAFLSDNMEILLTGFGCIKDNGTGGNDGSLWIGETNIYSYSLGSNRIVTKGRAALCFGDSGGAAFKISAGGKRAIIGVNAKAGAHPNGGLSDESLLSSTSSGNARDFYKAWRKAYGEPFICLAGQADPSGICHI